ncbi:MAG: thiolase domain-containing protein [Nitrospirae bacterium]|nr:thiolase domain-containing protein [Nitrospirota bacterium]
MYITGIGRTKFGVLRQSLPELSYAAISAALSDAEMEVGQLDAIFIGNFCGGPTQSQLHINALIADILPVSHIPIIRIETACASGGAALYQALISLSRFNNVMVVGMEKLNVESVKATSAIAMAADRLHDQAEGLIFPASYALIAQQHMLRYGTELDDLAFISLKNHENANLNEFAHFYNTDIDINKIIRSPVVCSPLRLYDCAPLSDGASAVVVSKTKRRDRDVKVIASSCATGNLSLTNTKDITSFPAVKIAVLDAYKQADLSPKDIDIFMVHDCFTIAEIIAMEDIGICKPGESKHLVREGRTKINGDIPVNTDGGLKADGHPIGASGLAQVFEIVKQLRSEAGNRQVKNASIGLTHNVGGVGGTAVIHIFRKD